MDNFALGKDWFLEQRDISGDLALFTNSIKVASGVRLFEGLPHQTWERDILTSELKTKKTVNLHGYPFYDATLPLRREDAEVLRGILADPGSYHPFRGEKLCGGFHPDYSVSWKHD